MDGTVALVLITLFAAGVNGALGYGFSSLTMPVALLFYTNRLLNPAIVLIEICVNLYVLFMNRKDLAAVWKRVSRIVMWLPIGVAVGSYFVSSLHPGWIKLFTYIALMPLILVQAAGIRRPIQSENGVGMPLGIGIGFFYAVTTISGPPLAVWFNNQGLVKGEFRAALGILRIAASTMTAMAYYSLGLYSAESFSLLQTILPSVIIGIPVGYFLIRKMDAEVFRRICMTFDVWVVSFGLSRVLMELRLVASPWAWGVMVVALLIDAWLLYRFFTQQRRVVPAVTGPGAE